MILGVSGYRGMSDYGFFCQKMQETIVFWGLGMPEKLVSGGARGADAFAERWALAHDVAIQVIKPDWKKHGKAAGIIRNGDIINASTHLVAFPSPKGRGTQDAIKKAKARGIPTKVWLCSYFFVFE